jgi:hypothetical protein
MNKRQLYAFGEPLGECVTRMESGRMVCGGGGGGSSSTAMPEIPTELKPLAKLYTNQATSIAGTPFQAYTGQRYADLNGTQNQALDMIQQRAANGSPVMDQANQTLTSTLQGGNMNPYLDQMVQKAQSSVADNWNTFAKPQTESAMVNSGSFGNSGLQQMQDHQQKAAVQQSSDIATQMYGNAYNTDRANQMSALSLAPTFGNQAYTDAGQLLNAGNTQQNAQQNNLDFGYQQFQDAKNDPYKKLQAIGGVVGQSTGQKTTTSGGGK